MNKIIIMLAALTTTLLLPGTAGSVSAQDTIASSQPAEKVVVISHVDVMPQYTAAATELLKKYRKQSLNEPGAKKIAILQQLCRPNHFTIVEEWPNEKALNEHVSAAQTKEFRADLQSMLGSPYDERPHLELE